MTPEPIRSKSIKEYSLLQSRLLTIAAAVSLCVALAETGLGQKREYPTADLLSQLIRIDTSNPPGDESKVAEFLAARLRPLGFDVHIAICERLYC